VVEQTARLQARRPLKVFTPSLVIVSSALPSGSGAFERLRDTEEAGFSRIAPRVDR
jgi:hypothetical protein